MSKRILVVSSLYYPHEPGGAERSTRAIVQGYKRQGVDVEVLTTAVKGEDGIRFHDGVKVHALWIPHAFWRGRAKNVSIISKILWRLYEPMNFFTVLRVLFYFRRNHFDWIHSNNIGGFSPWIWFAFRLRKTRILHTSRDYYLLCKHSGYISSNIACKEQCFSCRAYTSTYRFLSNHVDSFVGVSEFVENEHRRQGYFKNAKSTSIPNIFNLHKDTPDREFSPSKVTVGIYGGIRPEKGVLEGLMMLHCTKQYKAGLIHCIIAGPEVDKGYAAEMMEYIKPHHQTKYIGTNPPNEFFNKIDVLFNPALWHEPFPRTLIEAYSFGIPVISSDKGGTKEAVNKVCSKLVYNDLASLTKALETILKAENYLEYKNKSLLISREYTESNVMNSYLKCID